MWRDLSPIELLQYIIVLLRSTDQEVTLPSNEGISMSSLSRDRLVQIRRTLCFPELEPSLEGAIDLYLRNTVQGFSLQEVNTEGMDEGIENYLLGNFQSSDFNVTIERLRRMNILLDDHQLDRLKSVRKYFRAPELTMWFMIHLLISLTLEIFCKKKNVNRMSVSTEQILSYLIQGLYWLTSIPLSHVLPPDVHVIGEFRRCKSGPLRRMCSFCSQRGSVKRKRTKYGCVRCHKAFCFNNKCFELFHQYHGMKYYRYSNIDILLSVFFYPII